MGLAVWRRALGAMKRPGDCDGGQGLPGGQVARECRRSCGRGGQVPVAGSRQVGRAKVAAAMAQLWKEVFAGPRNDKAGQADCLTGFIFELAPRAGLEPATQY